MPTSGKSFWPAGPTFRRLSVIGAVFAKPEHCAETAPQLRAGKRQAAAELPA